MAEEKLIINEMGPNVNSVTSLVETDETLDQPIEEQEIRVAIKSLKTNKAPGLDGLPPVIFKSFNNQLDSINAALFNKLLLSRYRDSNLWVSLPRASRSLPLRGAIFWPDYGQSPSSEH